MCPPLVGDKKQCQGGNQSQLAQTQAIHRTVWEPNPWSANDGLASHRWGKAKLLLCGYVDDLLGTLAPWWVVRARGVLPGVIFEPGYNPSRVAPWLVPRKTTFGNAFGNLQQRWLVGRVPLPGCHPLSGRARRGLPPESRGARKRGNPDYVRAYEQHGSTSTTHNHVPTVAQGFERQYFNHKAASAIPAGRGLFGLRCHVCSRRAGHILCTL